MFLASSGRVKRGAGKGAGSRAGTRCKIGTYGWSLARNFVTGNFASCGWTIGVKPCDPDQKRGEGLARLGLPEVSGSRGFDCEGGAGCDGFSGLWNGR